MPRVARDHMKAWCDLIAHKMKSMGFIKNLLLLASIFLSKIGGSVAVGDGWEVDDDYDDDNDPATEDDYTAQGCSSITKMKVDIVIVGAGLSG